jgi:hypothetical protein
MAIPINTNSLDPGSLYSSPARPLAGVVKTGDITPSDSNLYGDGIYARWLYVGVSGNLTYVKWDGTTQLLSNLPVGWHCICSIGVKSTGTTATNLVWGD